MMQRHWKIITPSPYPHERQALDFIRAGLPDHEPYRAWPTFEFQATHVAADGMKRRARQYLVARAASEEQRPHIQRATEREFRLLQSPDHPNIRRAYDFKIHDFGPVLLFDHADSVVRLDHDGPCASSPGRSVAWTGSNRGGSVGQP